MVLVAHLMLAFVYMAIAIVFYYYRPKTINSLIGYRTRKSMLNERTWKEANSYSAKMFLLLSFTVLIFQVVTYSMVGGMVSFKISCAYLTLVSVATVPITELHLSSIFDSQGKQKVM